MTLFYPPPAVPGFGHGVSPYGYEAQNATPGGLETGGRVMNFLVQEIEEGRRAVERAGREVERAGREVADLKAKLKLALAAGELGRLRTPANVPGTGPVTANRWGGDGAPVLGGGGPSSPQARAPPADGARSAPPGFGPMLPSAPSGAGRTGEPPGSPPPRGGSHGDVGQAESVGGPSTGRRCGRIINGVAAEKHWNVDPSYDGLQAGYLERGRRDSAGRLCSGQSTLVKIGGSWVPTLYPRFLCTDGCEGDWGRTRGCVFDAQRERQARQERWGATKLARARATAERRPRNPGSHSDPGALEGKDDDGRSGDGGGVRVRDDVSQDDALAHPVKVAGGLDRTVIGDGDDGGSDPTEIGDGDDEVKNGAGTEGEVESRDETASEIGDGDDGGLDRSEKGGLDLSDIGDGVDEGTNGGGTECEGESQGDTASKGSARSKVYQGDMEYHQLKAVVELGPLTEAGGDNRLWQHEREVRYLLDNVGQASHIWRVSEKLPSGWYCEEEEAGALVYARMLLAKWKEVPYPEADGKVGEHGGSTEVMDREVGEDETSPEEEAGLEEASSEEGVGLTEAKSEEETSADEERVGQRDMTRELS